MLIYLFIFADYTRTAFKGCQQFFITLWRNKTMFKMFIWAATVLQVILVSANTEPRAYHSAPNTQTNYIITSKPFTVRDDANAGTIKWRRDTITGASLIGASDPAKMKYSIECTDNNECAGIELGGSDATFKPYTQDELNRILKRYGEADSESESSDKILSYDDSGNQDKSKASWNLVDPQQQSPKNPYDDRRGWVTLEPMAWSSSHIQKWEPNNRPTWPPPPQDHAQPGYSPWASNRPIQRPSNNYNQPQQQPSDWTTERPWIRPTYDYSPKPQHTSNYQKPSAPHNSQSYYGWNNADQDIITDGKPGQFPADTYHKPWNGDYGQTSYSGGPRPTETEGDGQWVLLSSTKGYSIPHRPNRSLQARSISIDTVNRPVETLSRTDTMTDGSTDSVSRPMSSKRTVRLMVLPPEKGSQNTTTSHNGMIEVDVSRKSVDQEQREFAARALKDSENNVQAFSDRSAKANEDRRAVLAAVGAGMLPAATMAMFLPMMVGRKRRDLMNRPEVVLHHHVYPR
jgi:hypothetical protein